LVNLWHFHKITNIANTSISKKTSIGIKGYHLVYVGLFALI